ncbi:MAG: ribonuclease III [Candidatus Sumerlaeia bacterium]|nr:ribonuclease III [Candidatus Sumerlaeia bacterium]
MSAIPVPEQLRHGVRALLQRCGLPEPDPAGEQVLTRAFLHRSWSKENPGLGDNERLEFLGDAVIGAVASLFLYKECPAADEGELSKLRAAMVSRRVLGRLAQESGVSELILLGVGEEGNGGRRRSSITGSALEAFCGALSLVYPWELAEPAIREVVIRPALRLTENRVAVDYKSRLQEWAQKHHQEVPEYRVLAAEGPDHSRTFRVEVAVGGRVSGQGEGARIKWAENEAARFALRELEHEVGRDIPGNGVGS